MIPDSFGIFCNYSGDSYVPRALACLSMENGGGERWEFIVRSRSGRIICRYLRLDRCSIWRVKFIPARFRRKGPRDFPDRGAAERFLSDWNPTGISDDPR